MVSEAQTIIKDKIIDTGYSKQDAIHTLYTELEKGVRSMKMAKYYNNWN